jgi:hypothetical protein
MSDTGNSDARSLELLAIQSIMSNEDGRHFMWRLLEYTGVSGSKFDNDPYRNAFNSGQQSVGEWLTEEMKQAAMGSYIEMLRENLDE